MFGYTDSHVHVHHGPNDPRIPGVTEDTVLRPAGLVLFAFGASWALFAKIAVAAGTFDVPRAAVAMIVAGLLMAAIGKKEQQI
jgi:hypothetical protein